LAVARPVCDPSLVRCVPALLLLLAACAQASESAPAPSPSADPAPASAPESAPEPAPEPEPTCTLTPGTTRASIDVAGLTREYELFVGADVGRRPPLVFLWHGWGGNAVEMLQLFQPETYFRDAIVVAPEGLPRSFKEGGKVKPGWQNRGGELQERDFALFDALLAALARSHCIDPARVYATGFSNGGFFTNALACHRPDALAAVAPRAGGGPYPDENCGGALPILISHGHKDVVIKFEIAERSLQRWAGWAGCEPPATLPEDGCVDLGGCSDPVRFCATPGGHSYPKQLIPKYVAEFFRGKTR
jgi:polyhydroxybutyrate depolymerase